MFIHFENGILTEIKEFQTDGFIACYSLEREVKIGDKEIYYNFSDNHCRKKEGDELWLIEPSLLPIDLKIVDGIVQEKTLEEKFYDGLITKEEYNSVILLDYQSQLQILDEKAIRPLRAILSGTGTEDDTTRLKSIEAEAEEIRRKIKELESE